MSVSDWDNEYARWARVASQIRATPGLRSSSTADLQQGLRAGLHQLDSALNALPLPPQEVQRRRRLLQHLQQTTSTTDPQSSSTGGSRQQQQSQSLMGQAMQQQDAMIDQLAVGVGRLKNQSAAIGEEADAHVNLLNEMDTGLDAAQDSLNAETRRAAALRQEGSLWRLQLIVAGLFVLLVLEIFLGLTP